MWWRPLREWLRAEPAADPPFRVAPLPITVYGDGPVDEVTEPTVAVGMPRVQPKRAPAPYRHAIVVNMRRDEWLRAMREAQPGESLGDVIRRWAGLPKIDRGL